MGSSFQGDSPQQDSSQNPSHDSLQNSEGVISEDDPMSPYVLADFEGPSFESFTLAPWNVISEDIHVTGTLVWYFSICQRQAWLMSRQIVPDEDDPNIEFGRFLHKQRYQKERKEYSIFGGRIDLVHMGRESLLITEVKKSSRYEEAATNQILFYLKRLEEQGIAARGELRIPEEKKRIPVVLDEQTSQNIRTLEEKILRLIQTPEPPSAQKTRWCKNCGYREFCWS